MNRLIFLISTLIFLPKTSNAQYIPTAVDSAVWKVACGWNVLNQSYDNHIVYFTQGDTVVNNVQYYKVYGKTTYQPNEPVKLQMLIRDNIFTNTVHVIYLDTLFPPCTPFTDVVLFDFNSFLTSGSSLSTCYGTQNVFDVDTFNIYGMNRRRIASDLGYFIEGVGSSTTGLFPTNSSNCNLVTYCRGTPEDCGAYAWVNTKDIRTYQTGKLYPNPTRTQSKLELQSYLENGKIQVFNLLGQLQQEQYFNGQEAILDVSQLNEGVYMIQIFENKQLVFGDKLFVID